MSDAVIIEPDIHIDLRMLQGKPDKRLLVKPYSVVRNGLTYSVLPPFVTDGSTIPAPFWPWTGGKFDYGNVQAGVVHDAGYAGKLFLDGKPCWISPEENDMLWREIRTALLCYGASGRKQALYRSQGWLAWAALKGYYRLRGRKRYVTEEQWKEIHEDRHI